MSSSKTDYLQVWGRGSKDSSKIIFDAFFADVNLEGANILEFGPGRCEMLHLFSKAGANCYGVDNNKSVIKIGRSYGYTMFFNNFNEMKEDFSDMRFNGVFGKGVFSAYKRIKDDKSIETLKIFMKYLKTGGWSWLLPYNTIPRTGTPHSQWHYVRKMKLQIDILKSYGFQHVDLTPMLRRKYAYAKHITNRPLFIYNLNFPEE